MSTHEGERELSSSVDADNSCLSLTRNRPPFDASTTIAMADYEMEKDVYELNFQSARLAKEACEEATAKDPSKPRFVMGSLGPTNRTGSISPVRLLERV